MKENAIESLEPTLILQKGVVDLINPNSIRVVLEVRRDVCLISRKVGDTFTIWSMIKTQRLTHADTHIKDITALCFRCSVSHANNNYRNRTWYMHLSWSSSQSFWEFQVFTWFTRAREGSVQGTLKNLVLFLKKRNDEYEFYIDTYTCYFLPYCLATDFVFFRGRCLQKQQEG